MTEKKLKTVPIFFAVDDNYAPLLGVAINSLARHASPNRDYTLHILHLELSQKNKQRLSKLKKDNVHIHFNNVKESVHYTKNLLHTRDYYSKTTYFRMFIANMFKEYDKALYLDCDIVLNGDIARLYNIDLKDNYVGAAVEDVVCSTEEFINYSEKHLGVNAGKYFNAGILSMNLKAFREQDIESRFYELISRYTFTVAQDQDYLNILCKDKVHYLNHKWNKTPDRNVFKVERPALIHYKLTSRPWQFDGVQYEDLFWTSAAETPFLGDLKKMKRGFTPAKRESAAQMFSALKASAELKAESGIYTRMAKPAAALPEKSPFSILTESHDKVLA